MTTKFLSERLIFLWATGVFMTLSGDVFSSPTIQKRNPKLGGTFGNEFLRSSSEDFIVTVDADFINIS